MFIPRAQPHAQSRFLFPIVFGINLLFLLSFPLAPLSAILLFIFFCLSASAIEEQYLLLTPNILALIHSLRLKLAQHICSCQMITLGVTPKKTVPRSCGATLASSANLALHQPVFLGKADRPVFKFRYASSCMQTVKISSWRPIVLHVSRAYHQPSSRCTSSLSLAACPELSMLLPSLGTYSTVCPLGRWWASVRVAMNRCRAPANSLRTPERKTPNQKEDKLIVGKNNQGKQLICKKNH